jgi:hypothetical protein
MSPTTVEIEGFGTVIVRGLSKGRVKRIRRMDTLGAQAAEVIKRGLVKPELTVDLATELGNRLDVLDAIASTILERSWPNEV